MDSFKQLVNNCLGVKRNCQYYGSLILFRYLVVSTEHIYSGEVVSILPKFMNEMSRQPRSGRRDRVSYSQRSAADVNFIKVQFQLLTGYQRLGREVFVYLEDSD